MQEVDDLKTLLEGTLDSNLESARKSLETFSDSSKVTLLDEEEIKSEASIREPSLILSDYTEIEEKKYNLDKSIEEFKKQYPDLFNKLEQIEKEKLELENKQTELKDEMLKSLENAGLKTISNNKFSVMYVAETQRTNFDRKSFEKKYPELCKQFITISKVNAYTKWTKVK